MFDLTVSNWLRQFSGQNEATRQPAILLETAVSPFYLVLKNLVLWVRVLYISKNTG
jgi:hypothetical protein